MTLVSIIIPTYNMRRYIGEAVDSALAQTYPHCEIIVIDDGSTDGTRDYLKERHGGRIRYYYQQNQRQAAARNHGLSVARGEYIQFLDADDILYRDKIEWQVRFLDAHAEYAAVYGDVMIAYEDRMERVFYPRKRAFYVSGDILEQEIHNSFLWMFTALIRKHWIDEAGGFDKRLRTSEDWDLILRMASRGGEFAYLADNPVGVYRLRRNLTKDPLLHPKSRIEVLCKLEDSLDPAARRRLRIRQAMGRYIFSYGCILADNGCPARGAAHMVKGVILDRRNFAAKLTRVFLALLPVSPEKRQAIFIGLDRLKDKLCGFMG